MVVDRMKFRVDLQFQAIVSSLQMSLHILVDLIILLLLQLSTRSSRRNFRVHRGKSH